MDANPGITNSFKRLKDAAIETRGIFSCKDLRYESLDRGVADLEQRVNLTSW